MKKFYLLCALVAVSLTAMAQSRVDSIITQFFDEWVENDSLISYEMRDLDTVYVYDANNNLISKQTYQFTSLETAPMGWKLIQSDDYVYDANNHCIEYTHHEWKQGSGWNASYEWKNTLKHEYTYENGNLKTDIHYDYDSYREDLYANLKDVYFYNTLGQSERIDTYGYNSSTSSWKANPTYRTSYTYNEYNLVSEEISQEYISSAWTNKSKKNYTYTSNLKLDYAINYKWNATAFSPKFEPYTKLQYSFDSNGNLVNEKWFQYSNGGWDETHNFAYTYNTQNLLITYIHSYSTTSSLAEKKTYEYDADGDLYRMSKFNWDNTYNDWVGYRRYYYYYQGKPSPTYELLIYADFLGEDWTYEEAEQCWVTGSGRHPYNSTIQCYATCPDGCRFVRWMDGNTDNPRTFAMTGNYIVWAYFSKNSETNALEDVTMSKGSNKFIQDGQIYIIKDGKIFSPLGTEIKTTQH